MTNKELAKKLVNDLFECGSEPNSPAKRIQFMGGSWAEGTETDQGGFCKEALEGFIERRLNEHLCE